MIILPAIDIIDGQPVRLYQGDYGQKEIVGDSVPKLADRFVAEGANICIWLIWTVPKLVIESMMRSSSRQRRM